MVACGGCSGWGRWAWAARLTCHFGILRLITRGADRHRRIGLRRSRMRRSTACQCAWAVPGCSGGKSALLGDGLTHDAQRGDKADPVGIVPGVRGGVGHHRADRVVTAQMSPDLLQHKVRRL